MTALLDIEGLVKHYTLHHAGKPSLLHAVDDVDLHIDAGESVGLVGESGCGKSTLVRLAARLIDPTSGVIAFEGRDLATIPLRRFVRDPARPRIQVVFQDPTESLNPSMSVFDAIADPLRRLGGGKDLARQGGFQSLSSRVAEAIAMVGLPPEMAPRYPHQLSGGQRARVGIARAIALHPALLILDEPTSALDVSVQAVILRLLADLRARLGMSYLFVSHDLNVVRLLCNRIVVMYLGRVVEQAPAQALFEAPRHPYTQALLASIPDPAQRGTRPPRLDGAPGSPIDPDPNACRFYGRCPRQQDLCQRVMPPLRAIAPDHLAACHFADPAPAAIAAPMEHTVHDHSHR